MYETERAQPVWLDVLQEQDIDSRVELQPRMLFFELVQHNLR